MKLLTFFFYLLLPVSFVVSQHRIDIRVLDESGFSLPGALAKSNCSDQIFESDENGHLVLTYHCGDSGIISIMHPLYKAEFRLFVNPKEQDYTVVMKKEILLEEIHISSSAWQADKVLTTIRLDAEYLEKNLADKDIPYLLSSLASVQVQSDAGNGIGYTGFRIRGIDPNQVQISLNGIPLNDSESSRTYFVNTPDLINDVDHLDVLTGYVPGRAGTGGFGAAVDLFTNKTQIKPIARFKSQIGSYNSLLNSLYLSSGLIENKFSVEGRVSRQISDGYIERSSSILNGIFLGATVLNSKSSFRINFLRGDERTGQAWFGLPYSYFCIDSLRRFNVAGRERPGKPYPNDIDQYTQTHTQLFYNYRISSGTNFVVNGNFTDGYGYYENYRAGQLLSEYGLQHPDSVKSDLVRRKWLDNDFYYLYLGIEQIWNPRHSSSFGLSGSRYTGNHFGRVNWVALDNISHLMRDYYRNKGIKNEITFFAKHAWKFSEKLLIASDFHSRFIGYMSAGTDDSYGDLDLNRRFLLLNPKLAAQYKFSDFIRFSASASWYEREPYRDDLLSSPGVDKEKLLDLELGVQWIFDTWGMALNAYSMNYYDYLALNGDLNDTGDPLRTQIATAQRKGGELNLYFTPRPYLRLDFNAAISDNRTGRFDEVLPSFGTIPARVNAGVDRRSLAFSPSQLTNLTLSMDWGRMVRSRWAPESIYTHKWVGKQYLDLSGSDEAVLAAYSAGNLRLNWQGQYYSMKIKGFVQVHNIWSEIYSTHGWIQRFVSDLPLDSGDPYLGAGTEGTGFYKGLYPQAPRHYTAGISVEF